jgi:hypothetical protein
MVLGIGSRMQVIGCRVNGPHRRIKCSGERSKGVWEMNAGLRFKI